jgi:hypothetical protein
MKKKNKSAADTFPHIKNLARAFVLAGYQTTIDTYSPMWCEPVNKPKTVISIGINETDGEGNPIEFLFDAKTGKRI